MTSRRRFLAGLLASGVLPAPSWADAGSPAYLSAAKDSAGAYVLVGLSDRLDEVFRLPLPARGHAAAAHPNRPVAVAFARRPGLFALVVDCRTGTVLHRLNAPAGRHFYGHGVFSRDGTRLFTTENDYENARGVVGIWDAQAGYGRLGEIDSGGIGPHDIRLLADGTLVVANGGIETHPDSGRTKLNISTMEPNLTYLSPDGRTVDQMVLKDALQRNSIRHLSVRRDGAVAFAMQWQGDGSADLPLAGLHRPGEDTVLLQAEAGVWRAMKGYVGSIAFSQDGGQIGLTSPRGGVFLAFDAGTGQVLRDERLADVCGVSGAPQGFVVTTGTGTVRADDLRTRHALAFDNHLVRV